MLSRFPAVGCGRHHHSVTRKNPLVATDDCGVVSSSADELCSADYVYASGTVYAAEDGSTEKGGREAWDEACGANCGALNGALNEACQGAGCGGCAGSDASAADSFAPSSDLGDF